VDDGGAPEAHRDLLAGPFAHVVVDEAQELTDAEWQMVLRRCPSHSLTVVGDRTQARHGFAGSWEERLARLGLKRVAVAPLTVNYRTPREVMAVAEPVVRAAVPDANVPVSVRSTGVPVGRAEVSRLDEIVRAWLREHPEGTACVIGAPGYAPPPRVRSLTPALVKGLEFDLVVLVEPDRLGDGVEGAVDRYVAMTRATARLVVLEDG
jgi:superfamily I DNA/RNA helicase